MKRLIFLIGLLLSSVGYPKDRFNFPQGQVELLSVAGSVGVYFQLQPDWHIYWKNPGDSGASPKWTWSPPEVKIGEPRWPLPKRIEIEGLINFGYEKSVFFPFPIEQIKPDTKNLQLSLEFLVCKVECIPYQTQLETVLSSASVTSSRRWQEAQADSRYPEAMPITGIASFDPHSEFVNLEVDFSDELMMGDPHARGRIEIFPEDGALFQSGEPSTEFADSKLRARLPLTANAEKKSSTVRFLLVSRGPSESRGWTLEAPLQQGPPEKPTAQPESFLLILLWSFLGGAILNLMPCVFPVLGLKILSFWGPGKDSKRLLLHSAVYSAGVLASFLALGGLLLILRSMGEQVGWGFQLQSPSVVMILAVLFFWLALNMLGFLEITWTPSLGDQGHGQSFTSSFMTGVLATVVATPCTAPFMGAAIGAALALPPSLTLLVFAVLGLGMAAPFLLLGLFPQWLRWLPRPGNWMVRLKEFMAFPLLLTSIWLLWVLGQQASNELVSLALVLMVAAALATWAYSMAPEKLFSRLALALGIVVSFGLPLLLTSTHQNSPETQPWGEFSAEKVEEARSKGQAVFIDFTAAWCITCQVNKKLVLNTDAVMNEFRKKNVVLFRADWTDRDPRITAALEKLGRNSLPVYAYYAPRAEKPLLLPEILTREIVFETLKGEP